MKVHRGFSPCTRKAEEVPPHKWEPRFDGGNLLILEGATRPLHPQAMHLNSRKIQPHDDGSLVSGRCSQVPLGGLHGHDIPKCCNEQFISLAVISFASFNQTLHISMHASVSPAYLSSLEGRNCLFSRELHASGG